MINKNRSTLQVKHPAHTKSCLISGKYHSGSIDSVHLEIAIHSLTYKYTEIILVFMIDDLKYIRPSVRVENIFA